MNATLDLFPTIFDLRAQHVSLLSKQRQGTKVDELALDVRDFLRRAQITGAILDADEQRDAAQGLIDYWVTTLYRASIELDEVTLAEFDANLAPTLADELCPYVGLEAFREKDSNRFYGRRKLVETAVAILAKQRFVAVVGPSGSGKSSVVLGGILPALRRGAIPGSDTWTFVPPFVPGSEPMKNLEAALAQCGDGLQGVTGGLKPAAPLCIVIDQFEEVFTLCDDLSERDAFARIIVLLAQQHSVIVTMRSDYESRLVTNGALQELFANGDLRATPLGAPELREAIEEPARLIGLKFESGLVDALVHDVLGEPAALPLLQFTLWKLWQSRDHNRITMASYRRLGGGRAALANSANALYESLIQQDRDTMRRILLRVVRPAAGAEVTSSRVRIRELLQLGDDQERVRRVLGKLVAEKLVRRTGGGVADDDQVEVAHEALIRNWPLLVSWIERQQADFIELRRFEVLAEEWERFGRTSGFLDEEQLREAEEWLSNDAARDFGIKESLPALVKGSRELIEERVRAQRRARLTVYSIGTILVVAIIALLAFKLQNERAAKGHLEAAMRDLEMQKQLALQQKQRAEENLALFMEARETANDLTDQIADEYKAEKPAPAPRQTAAWGAIASPRERVRPLWPGVSISPAGDKSAGSICCVVQDDHGTYLLTLGFVAGEKPGTAIVQPGVADGGSAEDRIGTVVRVDETDVRGAALIRLDEGVTANPAIPNVGRITGTARGAKKGETLRLIGRGSGLATVRVRETRPDGQIVIDFKGRGDAGAPVVNAKGQLVGILWGGDDDTSFLMPAARILRDARVKLAK
jgi:energy-coupling factor transporter ATP-binding protein EcfA2